MEAKHKKPSSNERPSNKSSFSTFNDNNNNKKSNGVNVNSVNNTNYRLGPLRSLLYIVVLVCLVLIIVELRGFGRQSYHLDYLDNEFSACGDLPSSLQQEQQQQGRPIIIDANSVNENINILRPSATPETLILPRLTNSSLAIMVLSRRDAFRVRKTIRETWGQHHDNIYFVLGQGCTVPISLRAKDEGGNPLCQVMAQPLPNNYMELTQQQYDKERLDIDVRIQQEHALHKDIILGTDFVDIYRSLPKKIKTAYTFVHEHLPSVEWVLKVDDDFFVRVDDFEEYLMTQTTTVFPNPRTTPYVVGYIRRTNKPAMGGKWKEVPQYNHQLLYPPFPLGSRGHAISRPLVDYIYQNQHLLFDYQGEDVSLGIWLQDDFTNNNNDIFIDASDVMVNNKDCLGNVNLVIGHNLNMDDMRQCQEWIDNGNNDNGMTPQQQLMELKKLNQRKFKDMIKSATKRIVGGEMKEEEEKKKNKGGGGRSSLSITSDFDRLKALGRSTARTSSVAIQPPPVTDEAKILEARAKTRDRVSRYRNALLENERRKDKKEGIRGRVHLKKRGT